MKLLLNLLICALCARASAQTQDIIIRPRPLHELGNFAGRGIEEDHHQPFLALQDIRGNPLRRVDGTVNNLGFLIKWDAEETARESQYRFAGKVFHSSNRPLPLWNEYFGRVKEAGPEGMLVDATLFPTSGALPNIIYRVKNFPGASAQLVGRTVSFFARRTGSSTQNSYSGLQRVVALDYGEPVRPAPLPAKTTNAIPL